MTPSPNLVPSGSNYNGSGYSHWGGKVAGNGSSFNPEPQGSLLPNGTSSEPCVIAVATRPYADQVPYAYLLGSSASDRISAVSKYFRAYDDQDLWGWQDVWCDWGAAAICELTGAHILFRSLYVIARLVACTLHSITVPLQHAAQQAEQRRVACTFAAIV